MSAKFDEPGASATPLGQLAGWARGRLSVPVRDSFPCTEAQRKRHEHAVTNSKLVTDSAQRFVPCKRGTSHVTACP